MFNLAKLLRFHSVNLVKSLSTTAPCHIWKNLPLFKKFKVFDKVYTVHPGFGKLILNSESPCTICPANPQEHPDANFASVSLWKEHADSKDEANIDINLQGNDDILYINIDSNHGDGVFHVQIPFKYDIECSLLKSASVTIKNMESDSIEIMTKSGDIRTEKVRCHNISLTTDTGNIRSVGVLQGDIRINATNTTFTADRLQGQEVTIQAGTLNGSLDSCYVRTATLFAEECALDAKNCHGAFSLHAQTGKLKINGLRGSLQGVLDDGIAELVIDELTEDSLFQMSRGDLKIYLQDVHRTSLEARAPAIEVSECVDRAPRLREDEGGGRVYKHRGSSEVNLLAHVAAGNVSVAAKDWFSSLGLKK